MEEEWQSKWRSEQKLEKDDVRGEDKRWRGEGEGEGERIGEAARWM